jgi:hypothetical protein
MAHLRFRANLCFVRTPAILANDDLAARSKFPLFLNKPLICPVLPKAPHVAAKALKLSVFIEFSICPVVLYLFRWKMLR